MRMSHIWLYGKINQINKEIIYFNHVSTWLDLTLLHSTWCLFIIKVIWKKLIYYAEKLSNYFQTFSYDSISTEQSSINLIESLEKLMKDEDISFLNPSFIFKITLLSSLLLGIKSRAVLKSTKASLAIPNDLAAFALVQRA